MIIFHAIKIVKNFDEQPPQIKIYYGLWLLKKHMQNNMALILILKKE